MLRLVERQYNLTTYSTQLVLVQPTVISKVKSVIMIHLYQVYYLPLSRLVLSTDSDLQHTISMAGVLIHLILLLQLQMSQFNKLQSQSVLITSMLSFHGQHRPLTIMLQLLVIRLQSKTVLETIDKISHTVMVLTSRSSLNSTALFQ